VVATVLEVVLVAAIAITGNSKHGKAALVYRKNLQYFMTTSIQVRYFKMTT